MPLALLVPALALCGLVGVDSSRAGSIEDYFPGREVDIVEVLASRCDGGGVHYSANHQPVL